MSSSLSFLNNMYGYMLLPLDHLQPIGAMYPFSCRKNAVASLWHYPVY